MLLTIYSVSLEEELSFSFLWCYGVLVPFSCADDVHV